MLQSWNNLVLFTFSSLTHNFNPVNLPWFPNVNNAFHSRAQQSCTPKSKQGAREGTFHITINYAKDMSIQVQTDIFVYTFAMAESHGSPEKYVGVSDDNV